MNDRPINEVIEELARNIADDAMEFEGTTPLETINVKMDALKILTPYYVGIRKVGDEPGKSSNVRNFGDIRKTLGE